MFGEPQMYDYDMVYAVTRQKLGSIAVSVPLQKDDRIVSDGKTFVVITVIHYLKKPGPVSSIARADDVPDVIVQEIED